MTNEQLCERIQKGETALYADLLLQNVGMIHKTARRYAQLQSGTGAQILTI